MDSSPAADLHRFTGEMWSNSSPVEALSHLCKECWSCPGVHSLQAVGGEGFCNSPPKWRKWTESNTKVAKTLWTTLICKNCLSENGVPPLPIAYYHIAIVIPIKLLNWSLEQYTPFSDKPKPFCGMIGSYLAFKAWEESSSFTLATNSSHQWCQTVNSCNACVEVCNW